jgi:hypothetical protein
MPDKRMLIVDAEIARKVDENRGDMDRSEFIAFLIDTCLQESSEDNTPDWPEFATKADFEQFQQGTRELLKNFLEFFVSYGLEFSKEPKDKIFGELTETLRSLAAKGHDPQSDH